MMKLLPMRPFKGFVLAQSDSYRVRTSKKVAHELTAYYYRVLGGNSKEFKVVSRGFSGLLISSIKLRMSSL